MTRLIKLIFLIIGFFFLAMLIEYGIFLFYGRGDIELLINVPIAFIEVCLLCIISLVIFNKLGLHFYSTLIAAIILSFIITLTSAIVPESLKPHREFYGIRTEEKHSGLILTDEICHSSCPIVKRLVRNKKVVLAPGTETYIERKFYSYREAFSMHRFDFDDECCSSKTRFPSFGSEKVLFSIRLICEKTYYYFVSNWILIIIIVLIDLIKKEMFFKIDHIELSKILKLFTPIVVLIVIFNIIYWFELRQI